MLLNQAGYKRLGTKRVDFHRRAPFRERFDECVLGQFAVSVELVWRPKTLDSTRHAIGITEACAG